MRVMCLLVAMAIVFSGCAEDTSGDHVEAGSEDHGEEGHGDGPTVVNNTAPTANLTADILNGTAPLLVNVTLEGGDPDGDNLTWTLQQNGTEVANGTDLPATLAFNLTAGNHTLLLTVSDGNATATANLTIAVAEAANGADPNAPQDMGTFWYDPATGLCHHKSYSGYGSGPATVYNFDFWVFAETNGVPGLQVANNFLVGPAEGLGFADPAWDICEDGDQMVL